MELEMICHTVFVILLLLGGNTHTHCLEERRAETGHMAGEQGGRKSTQALPARKRRAEEGAEREMILAGHAHPL